LFCLFYSILFYSVSLATIVVHTAARGFTCRCSISTDATAYIITSAAVAAE
jgi:hypothetical protein